MYHNVELLTVDCISKQCLTPIKVWETALQTRANERDCRNARLLIGGIKQTPHTLPAVRMEELMGYLKEVLSKWVTRIHSFQTACAHIAHTCESSRDTYKDKALKAETVRVFCCLTS